ncbi:MAG: alanyl-tRNA editing protein AlaXM [Nitrososphaeria archaeon]
MTVLLFQSDSYLKDFEATVVGFQDNALILDRTAFHPLSGGVDHDIGTLTVNRSQYNVIQVNEDRLTGNVFHVVEGKPNVSVGDRVKGSINWGRRYSLMKLHTAAHILSSILYNKYNAYVTGGQIDPQHARDDFSLDSSDRQVFEDAIDATNSIIEKGIEVKVYFLSREEALKIPGIVKLAQRAPPNLDILRIVEVPGVDIQADGGPHVQNTKEIGEIALEKIENKGKGRKRVYYKLSE